jgi:hypothetical protein
MDHQGPGAIVRSWMPWRNQNNGGTDINLRIYLDGADVPALEGNMLGMFDGSGVIPYPFAHPSLRSAVNFFPIPYAKRCKVTTDQMRFFFQFTFRAYDEGTPLDLANVSGYHSWRANRFLARMETVNWLPTLDPRLVFRPSTTFQK